MSAKPGGYLSDEPDARRPSAKPKRVTTAELLAMKQAGRKIVMLTAYDALFAALLDQAGVDVILVGDSVGPVLAGEETTLPVTLGQMIYHGRSVQRGTSRALVVVDLPFGSYQVSRAAAVRNATRVLKRTGAGAIKLEGGREWAETVHALVVAGVPVMGHLGFTPQAMHVLGGIRVQGREASAAVRLIEDAHTLEQAGAFSLVLEFMSAAVARQVTAAVSIPTIGIGAGPHCDGQVLVLHDMLGLNERFAAKFVKRYGQLAGAVRNAVEAFGSEVRGGQFPDQEHTHA
jgi:3-methyl-2-oxobutanoate hydroxymethyltransferase